MRHPPAITSPLAPMIFCSMANDQQIAIMKSPKKDLSEEEHHELRGYNDKEIEFPHYPEQMDETLRQRPDGSFYIHCLTFDDVGEITGCIKKDVTREQAAEWWSKHFIPPVLRPCLSVK